jgi:DNA primase
VIYNPSIAHLPFTAAEIAEYYRKRCPRVRQTRARQWRGPCPVHDGVDDNFAVEAATGRWHCFSQCGRGGGIIKLEMELRGCSLADAKREVFWLVGRPDPAPCSWRGR